MHFDGCLHLESIKVCDLNLKELFDIIVKYSPKKFFSIYDYQIELQLLPEVLESFFISSWGNRVSFSLIIQKKITL